jgi:hypothetical protein
VVAQTAAPILQVGFEQRRHVAEALPAQLCRDSAAAAANRTASCATARWPPADIAHHRRVAGEAADAQQRGGSVEVVARELSSDFGVCTDGLSFSPASHSGYQRLSAIACTCGAAARLRVQQHDVDVAAGAQHAAGVPTRGSESPAGGQLAGQALEPGVGLL